MFQERAAIMEYDGGLTRPAAESAARSILAQSSKTCAQPVQICADSAHKPRRAAGPGYEAFKAALRKGGKHGH